MYTTKKCFKFKWGDFGRAKKKRDVKGRKLNLKRDLERKIIKPDVKKVSIMSVLFQRRNIKKVIEAERYL